MYSVFITPCFAPIRQLPKFLLHLFRQFRVYSEPKPLIAVKRIAQILCLADVSHTGFILVYLEEYFLLNIRQDIS